MFVNFEALQEHQSSNQRGTGLGLSICKQIIEKMGGTIEVTSKLGEGTQFKIDLIQLCLIPDSSDNSASIAHNNAMSNYVDDTWLNDHSSQTNIIDLQKSITQSAGFKSR